ncbi:hypothetical protein V6N13_077307 [Hibiscus sabdariffa]
MAVHASVLGTTLCLPTPFPRPKPIPPLGPHKTRGNAKSCFAALSTNSAKAAPPLQANSNQQEIGRPLGNFAPDIWSDCFLTLPFDYSEFESCSKQVQVLKAKVKDMLVASASDPIPNVHLIHTLCRSGVSHHFQNEIEKQLAHHFVTLSEIIKDYDLHTTAVVFQVFRFHGYNMSSAEAFHEQARWVHEGYHPTFDGYIGTAVISAGGNSTMAQVLIGMEEADEKAYQCLINTDNIIYKAINLMCRLYNDIATNEREEKRGAVTGTMCYMKQYGVSREEATGAFKDTIEAAFKDLKQALKPSSFYKASFQILTNVPDLINETVELIVSSKVFKVKVHELIVTQYGMRRRKFQSLATMKGTRTKLSRGAEQ